MGEYVLKMIRLPVIGPVMNVQTLWHVLLTSCRNRKLLMRPFYIFRENVSVEQKDILMDVLISSLPLCQLPSQFWLLSYQNKLLNYVRILLVSANQVDSSGQFVQESQF